MAEAENRISRRGVLGRLALLVGGAAAGAGAAVKVAGPAPTASTAEPGARLLTLRVPDLRRHTPAAVPGKLATTLETALPHGPLVDGRGREIGRFHASVLPGAGGSTLQTFELPEGTILGIGGQLAPGAAYAVVGGTGTYAGISGTYVARHDDAGARSTAEFEMTLRGWEA